MATAVSSAPLLENGVPPPPPAQDEPELQGLQPIPAKKTLMIVNSFIINTVDFLNKFTSVAEEKLRKVQQAIQRLEITLALLEGKLDSVPWVASGQPPPPSTTAAASVPATVASSSVPSRDNQPSPSVDSPPPPPVPVIALKDDDRYKKYFKMQSMGVPNQALRMKMSADGVDPDIIDMDPEGPAPDGGRMALSPTSQESPQSSSDDDEDEDDRRTDD